MPANIPKNEALYYYVFDYNKTHMGLVLDYGSIANHHESANLEAGAKAAGTLQFKVRWAFEKLVTIL